MIIARAAKGAALLLMIFGVVALIGCPAATAGKTGPAGAKGDTGAKGDPGAPGAPGTAPLQAKGDTSSPFVIYINNGGTDAAPLFGDVTKPKPSADVSDLFVGGKEPITYKISTEATGGNFTATEIKDNVLVIGKGSGATGAPAASDYVTGTTLTITATDANEIPVSREVAIRTNKKPAFQGPPVHARRNLIVGTQSEKYGTGATAKKARNVAEILDLTDTGGNAYFTDDGDFPTLEITKISRDGDEAEGAEHVMAEINRNGKGLKVTGLKSTWESPTEEEEEDVTCHTYGSGTPDPPCHVPVLVEITATDGGGLSGKTTIAVHVDGAPEVGSTALTASFVRKQTGASAILIRNLSGFYKDPEGAAVEASAVAAATSVDPSQVGAAAIAGGNLTFTPNNQGKATITYHIESSGHPTATAVTGQTAPLTNDPTLAANFIGGVYVDRDGDGTGDNESTITQTFEGTITVTVTPP